MKIAKNGEIQVQKWNRHTKSFVKWNYYSLIHRRLNILVIYITYSFLKGSSDPTKSTTIEHSLTSLCHLRSLAEQFIVVTSVSTCTSRTLLGFHHIFWDVTPRAPTVNRAQILPSIWWWEENISTAVYCPFFQFTKLELTNLLYIRLN